MRVLAVAVLLAVLVPLGVLAFGPNGESQITLFMPAPGEVPGLVGLTLHAQVLGQPQGQGCDLTALLSFTIE